MTAETDLHKAARLEAEAHDLHRRSRAAANLPASIILSSHRDGSKRLIMDEAEAHRAFAREVAASLQDPVVLALIERGVLQN